MSSPVIFLSFANNEQHPLPNLEREGASIRKILTPITNQRGVQIHFEPFAKIDNIAHFLTQFQDQVISFHYGGHADSKHLILKDQIAHASGIAYLLKQQKHLKLVFLNGCSTYEQIHLLLELGIPAVIATSAEVNDTIAAEFAEQFYESIANDFSIKKAFENAAAYINAKSGKFPQIYRGLGRKQSDNEILSWGLYVNNDPSILEKKLILMERKSGTEKNVIRNQEMEIDGNAHVGNKGATSDQQHYDRKNIIEGGKMKVKGDFRLGDG